MTHYSMAAGVNIINLRVLDQYGMGTDSQTIAAIQRAIALKSTYNIRVINLSFRPRRWESYTLVLFARRLNRLGRLHRGGSGGWQQRP